jgi:hypothetical protein
MFKLLRSTGSQMLCPHAHSSGLPAALRRMYMQKKIFLFLTLSGPLSVSQSVSLKIKPMMMMMMMMMMMKGRGDLTRETHN